VHAGAVTNREEIEDNSIPIPTQVEDRVVTLGEADQAGGRGMKDYPSSLRSSRGRSPHVVAMSPRGDLASPNGMCAFARP